MKYIRPDHYDDFQCIAEKCQHSCCVGWEIDIDAESFEYYVNLTGSIGEKLRRCIQPEPEPHFVLGENERCPFLNGSGLCELILELGEDALCNICTEHPRFYNEFSGRTECGLGACCEAAAELLLNGDKPLALLCEEDGENREEDEAEIFLLRDKIFAALSDQTKPFAKRCETAAVLCGGRLPVLDFYEWSAFFSGLERLDAAWTEKLEHLRDFSSDRLEPDFGKLRYERIAEYIVYRYFASAEDEDRRLIPAFAYLTAAVICALDLQCGEDTENLRLFSSEIEYSDENVVRILEKLADA